MKTQLFVCLLLALTSAVGGCRKSPSGPPVAVPSVSVGYMRVPLGSPVELTYQFKVAADARAFTEDYRVFVHFVDADEELMWTDDHYPPTPTTQWKPGQTIKYNRLMFAPVYPYVGDAAIEVGLYGKDNKRLTLAGTEKGQRAYQVAKIQVAPQTESIYLTFKDGWHVTEAAADNATNEWHWTKKDATLSFKNPKRNARFYLDFAGRPKFMTEPQTVTVSIGNEVVDTFQVGPVGEVRRIPLTVTQLGTEEQVELKLSLDRTFIPVVVTSGAQTDKRELGLCVFHAFIEAR
ncbi:MAG TPA: hypothetical protein VF332_01545 [Vicinamibacterales bacterium]